MAHVHHHHHDHGERNLALAIGVNIALTVAEIIGGVLSGSLALVADAVHNLSDAGSLIVALVARRVARQPASDVHTFGFQRAEMIGSLINLTTLVVIGLYLIFEGVSRIFSPEPVGGWIMVWVAAGALVVDAVTALLTWRMSKESMNIRAAFVHNVADALGSIAVIVAGSLVIVYGWTLADTVATFLISAYILYQGLSMARTVVHTMLDAVPEGLDVESITAAMTALPGVLEVHHLHVWQLGERANALEAHVVLPGETRLAELEQLKGDLKKLLLDRFSIKHVTLELESHQTRCESGETQC